MIITGGIDLSVGSVMGLSSLVTALAFQHGYSAPVAIGAGLGVGLAVGAFNGFMITWIQLPPFIATLGTLSIGRGLMYIITKGVPVTPDVPDSFTFIGQGYIGFVPFPVVILLAMTAVFSIVMRQGRASAVMSMRRAGTKWPRACPARARRASKFSVYVLSGLIASMAGVIAFSRFVSAEPASGFGAELDVIAAAAIGGASLSGGAGSVEGAIIGAALAGIITNGVVLLNIDTYAQQAITGCVILIAVSIDIWRVRRKER